MKINNKILLEEYNNKGWVKIKNLITKKDIDKINYRIDKFN